MRQLINFDCGTLILCMASFVKQENVSSDPKLLILSPATWRSLRAKM
jgi:hypothetical protein